MSPQLSKAIFGIGIALSVASIAAVYVTMLATQNQNLNSQTNPASQQPQPTTASLLMKPANPKYVNMRAIPNPPIRVRIKCICPRVTPNLFRVKSGTIEYISPSPNRNRNNGNQESRSSSNYFLKKSNPKFLRLSDMRQANETIDSRGDCFSSIACLLKELQSTKSSCLQGLLPW